MTAPPIRVLIVDDEPPARRKVRRFLESDPDFRVVGEAENGRTAIEAIRSLTPAVVFLDIQMPGVDGFGVLEALAGTSLPEIVFVTAFDQYAVEAFEVAALDYLLKPFDAERFAVAIQRAKRRVRETVQTPMDDRVRDLLERLGQASAAPRRILVKARHRSVVVAVEDIAWIRAAGNYVELHTAHATHLMRESLERLGERLDASSFVRVHRSTMVNVDHIREIQPLSHGDQLIVLRDGSEVRLSRRYRDRLPSSLLREE